MKRRKLYTEAAFWVGLVLLALGTAMTVQGDFGISMVVAPAYILHLKLSEFLPWFSFGAAEYVLQALVLLVLMLVLRKCKKSYFLAIATAVLYGFLLDGSLWLTGLLQVSTLWSRLGIYTLGVLLCTLSIALLFRSYLPPAAYELFVKELAKTKGWSVTLCKTVYDVLSLAVAVSLSLVFFGEFRGIGWGTVICAAIYGLLIRLFDKLLGSLFTFEDKLKVRKNYE